MTKVQAQPKPNWADLPRPGCENVSFRVLLGVDGIFIANLRFSERATIDEHAAPWEIDVIVISGAGYSSVGGEVFAVEAGQTIRWPKDQQHRLWTDGSEMETLMVERHDA